MNKLLKRILVVVIAVLLVFGMASCGVGNSPSAAALAFYEAAKKGDAKALAKVLTPQMAELITLLDDSMIEGIKEEAAGGSKVIKTSEKIDGNTAVVTFTFEDGETEDIALIKIAGKWKVDLGM